MKTYDVAVIGAGVFGAWTALQMARRGKSLILLEAYGPGHSRSSSGDESRIIRMGYGKDEIYTRWSRRSLVQWKELFAECGQKLFYETGVLWLAGADETRLDETRGSVERGGAGFQGLDLGELKAEFPQIGLDGVRSAILEPQSGVLLARRAVVATVAEAVRQGVNYEHALVETPCAKGKLRTLKTKSGEEIAANQFVFACGAWLAKLFPTIVGARLFVTRQEVFYFGLACGGCWF